ncbi:MAG: hypothetical protein IKU55_02190 [Clostridia bacterium]|nr:hypothetical protein [Clostridia bacterium]
MSKLQLAATMFGGFSVTHDGHPLLLWQNRGSRVTGLLQYLLFHQGTAFRREELFDLLFDGDERGDPSNTFRVTLFRLRKLLVAAGLPDEAYIESKNGLCGWNPEFPVETDVQKFLALTASASVAERENRLQDALDARLAALSLYRGELLPGLMGEDWVAVESTRLKNRYLDCLERAVATLTAAKEYEKIYEIATQAGAIYPYDEALHLLRIEALIELRRPKEALAVYETVTETYYAELGLQPSDAMNALHARIAEQTPANAVSLESVKQFLAESERKAGAFYCDALTFAETYRYLLRVFERSGQSAYLMLCTVTDTNGKPMADSEKMREGSEIAATAVCRSLRRGDMYTVMAPGQILVLLVGLTQENGPVVTARIERKFRELSTLRGVRLRFKLIAAGGLPESQTQGKPSWN